MNQHRMTALLLLTLLLSACGSTPPRVVSYRPMLSDLPGAQVGAEVVGDDGSARKTAADSTPDYFVEEEDGTLTAQLPTGAYLVYHLRKAIENDDEELLTTQLISQLTKQEFADRDIALPLAFREMKRRQKDMEALFRKMPQGELSPGVRMDMLSKKVARVRVVGDAASNLSWDGLDMVWEDGGWRLRWFTVGKGKSLAE